ncbi:diphosphomevalonate/mevalonate 3,5-bisphosphate decarboxylase family protein [Sungkyunkwania multivorans]|uniref:Diphosphomevalonate/mevalonate 3,5-bisphosphate decarboxylase family protein n=1 Tax=Sungkyunkwania multivorans TaxID=1173618 RepID=A0ABW3D0Z8_9FLAO
MTESDFIPSAYLQKPTTGSVTWKSPSNIALVKYWGKKEHQIPANPSISFTLVDCATTTTLRYEKLAVIGDAFQFDLIFEGQPKASFKPKIETFFERIESYLPFLKEYHFTIETSNSFPHSSGIASSASGMSALALCLMSLEKSLKPEMSDTFFNQKASFLARLGSGSACRSIEGPLIQWGEHEETAGSSDLYGVAYPYEVHEVFKDFQDTILLVDKGEKQVSSSVGHNLMHDHPYAKNRFKQAHQHLTALQEVFKQGDLKRFIEIVESEALTLHAMMMTSLPYYILMKPNTLNIINSIWKYRKETESNICFTLDAGANVHVLYPKSEKHEVLGFIKKELAQYCQNQQYICDETGTGAKKL